MSKIGNVGFVQKTISTHQFKIKKKFGQNFLTDSAILNQIVNASGVTKQDAVIEIGPGLGALTELLCERARFVLAYEVDQDLLPILQQNLREYTNYKILLKDILKVNVKEDIQTYLSEYTNIYVVANLPYYITTPILTELLSQSLPIQRYIMMMQLEVANRICGKPSTKEYNALSVWVEYRAKATKILKVPRSVFVPAPNVDSAVVQLEVYKELPLVAEEEATFSTLIRQCFSQRRKTLFNNLCLKYDKEFVQKMLADLHIPATIRAEALSLDVFVQMSNYLTQNKR